MVNDTTAWADYSVFQCQADNYGTEIHGSATATFSWPADGNIFNNTTTSFSAVTSGIPFACGAACIATYSNGTQSYILLLSQGTCE